jgi:hypothetical protein
MVRLPRKDNVSAAAKGLIGLSNSMRNEGRVSKEIIEIGRRLKLKFLLARYGE